MPKYIDIVFDGPPSPPGGHFVEVEDPSGSSISVGEWIQRNDGYWVLRLWGIPERGDRLRGTTSADRERQESST